jgi:hypothetical protein
MRVSRLVVVVACGAALATGATQAATAAPHVSSTRAGFTPFTAVDTRSGLGVAGPGRLQPGRAVTVPVLGRDGVPATGVRSVRVRLAALDPAGSGAFLSGDGTVLLRYRAEIPATATTLLPVTRGAITITSTAAAGLTATVVGQSSSPAPPTPSPTPSLSLTASRTAMTAVVPAAGGHPASLAGSALSVGRTDLAGVVVSAYDGAARFGDGLPTPTPLATATSSSAGAYVLAGLPAGPTHHLVLCFDGSHVAGSSSGYAPMCTQSLSPLTAGHRATAVPAYLTPGVRVEGTVRDSGGNPVAGVPVRLVTDQAPAGPATTTAANGSFSLAGGQDQDTQVCADGSALVATGVPYGYVPSCETVPTVGVGGTATGLALTVVPGGEVTGTVDGSGGAPLAGVAISVVPSHAVSTAADGTYTLTGVPTGSQSVCLQPKGVTAGTGYLDDCASDGQGLTTGVSVTVSTTSPAEADDTLAPAAAVGGVVTSGGKPVAGAHVYANPESVGFADTYTAADGSYRLVGLPAGSTTLCVDGSEVGATGYVQTCSQPALASGTTADADTSVTVGAAVAGTVTDSDGSPLAGVFVYASSAGAQSGIVTDVSGHYVIGGLAAADQSLCTYAGMDGGTSPTGYLDDCSDIGTVTAGSITTADPVLTTGGALTGRVLDAKSGAPLGNASVSLSGPTPYTVATTAADGSFEVVGLSPGTYASCAYGASAVGSWALGYLDGCPTNGPSVTVSAGAATAVADEGLARAGGISGRVAGAHGIGLGGVAIDLGSGASTGSDGSFVVGGLASGTYQVCFDATSAAGPSPTGYVGGCYGSEAGGTPVAVKAGHPATSIGTVVLAAGAEVAGTVTTTGGGSVVPGIGVQVLAGSTFASGTTDDSGQYAVRGLPAGTGTQVCFAGAYVLSAAAPAGYLDACKNTVHTKAGVVTTVSRALAPAGGISGVVTDIAGDPLLNVSIAPSEQSGPEFLQASSDQDGSYQLTGLTPTTKKTTLQVCYDGTYASSATTSGFGMACTQVSVVGGQLTSQPVVVLPAQ